MSEPLTYDVLAALIGEHAPVYDYRQGNFTMECEACDFVLGGVDRDEAKARFGGHFAAHVAEQLQPLIRQAQAEALREAADEMAGRSGTNRVTRWLRDRADQIEEQTHG